MLPAMDGLMLTLKFGAAVAGSPGSVFISVNTAADTPRFEKAFRRWLSRARLQHGLGHEQIELLRAAAGAHDTPFRAIGLEVLDAVCRELRIQSPSNSRSAQSGQ